MYPPVAQKPPFLHSWWIYDLQVTLFSFFIMHTKFQKNPSIFAESRANTNGHHFHAQTASWSPFWISNFSQTSSIWHVVILSNMLTQYENNRTCSVVTMVNRQMCYFTVKNEPKKAIGGHFEFPISADLLPYGMFLHLAIFLPNMKTIGPTLWPLWWYRQNGHFFIKNEPLVAILNFQFSPNSFPDILSPIPTPMLNFKRIRQHLQLVERER